MLTAWVAFPLLLGVLGYGCGALIERAAGRLLPLSVRLPTGVALTIGVLDLFTRSTSTVGAAIPAVCALAAGGFVFRPPWRMRPLDRGLIAPAIVFCAYGAPIVLSGSATWAGYVKLDDTATWLALVDRTLSAGHTLAGLAPSTYMDTLAAYLTNGYPVGSFLPLGLGHAFFGIDIAWLTDPWMAFAAAMLALSLHRIATRTLGSGARRWQAPAIAVVAAQPALLYGYYLWGGLKEMTGAMLVAAFASTITLAWDTPDAERDDHPDSKAPRTKGQSQPAPSNSFLSPTIVRRARATIPSLVVVWGMLSALSSGGLVWLVPGGVLALVALSQRSGLKLPPTGILVRAGGALVAVGAVAAYLALRPGGFVERNKGVLTGSNELGNLLAPLHLRQIVGIWLSGDFRTLPTTAVLTDVLIAVALVAGLAGLAMAVVRARRELTVYVLCCLTGALIVFWLGSPWLAGKALATASPAILLAGLLVCATATRVPWRSLGAVAAIAIVVGVVWSNLLGYHDAALAPRAQFSELEGIGEKIAGEGPTLMTDYSPYGARHFLREAEAESASELRSRVDPLISGKPLEKATTADIDQFQTQSLLVYRTLVLRRSPVASRPPSPYTLTLRDRYWEVWQRQAPPPVLSHLPLGNAVEPGGIPSCAAVQRLARTPGATHLVAVQAENPLVVGAGEGTHPSRWSHSREYLRLNGAGTAHLLVSIPRAGPYELWLGGSMSGPVTLKVNGTELGTARYELQEDGQYVPFGSTGLERGKYEISISYDGGDWRPGSGGPPATVGPLILSRETPEAQPFTVPLNAARSLCGRTLDWIEAVG